MSDLIALLRLRYRLAERIYFHPSKQCTASMVGRAILHSGFLDHRSLLNRFGDDTLLQSLAEGGTAVEEASQSANVGSR